MFNGSDKLIYSGWHWAFQDCSQIRWYIDLRKNDVDDDDDEVDGGDDDVDDNNDDDCNLRADTGV